MSTRITVTGNVGQEPELRFTPQNKAVLEVSVNGTRSQKDKQTGQWSDDGGQLWVRASFWERDAEHLASFLHKGDKVTISGDLVVEEYTTRDGTAGSKLVVRYPKFEGVIPKRTAKPIQQANTASFGAPVDDPWGDSTPTPQNGTQATDQWGGPSNVAPF